MSERAIAATGRYDEWLTGLREKYEIAATAG